MDVEKIILKDAELYLRDITKIGKTPKSISSISLATESGLYYVPSGGGNGMPVTSHNWLVLSIVDSTNNDPVTNYVHYAISYNGLQELPHLYYMIGGTNTWVRCVTGGDIVDVMAQSWAMSNPVPSASSVKSALGDKVDKSAIVTSVSSSSTDSEVASAKVVYDRTKDSVPTSAIVTSISSSSTDSEVASAKVVYDNTSDKVPKSAIATSISSSSTDDEVISAKCAYNNFAKKVNNPYDVSLETTGNVVSYELRKIGQFQFHTSASSVMDIYEIIFFDYQLDVDAQETTYTAIIDTNLDFTFEPLYLRVFEGSAFIHAQANADGGCECPKIKDVYILENNGKLRFTVRTEYSNFQGSQTTMTGRFVFGWYYD